MLGFIKIEFGLLSDQKRNVQFYIFLDLSKVKKLSSPLPLFINPNYWQDKNQRLAPDKKRRKRLMKSLKYFVFSWKKYKI